ncbi:toll-like receptor 4 [Haliotis rubra]|uniref:toll-like receptor 4 n=1 Tax=Haliotis rubra TaxID=36100 RepID=UPI001EE52310|nr:toll-like receptor 4 [Haliotis rubra]
MVTGLRSLNLITAVWVSFVITSSLSLTDSFQAPYFHLNTVSISSRHSCSMTRDTLLNGTSVDCQNRQLTDIPKALPADTVVLQLQHNHLLHLRNYSFTHLPELVQLYLSFCNLSSLEPRAFQGLGHLQTLRLDHNNLLLDNETYTSDIFLPLIRLRILDLSVNDPRRTGNIPDEIFAHLQSLKKLTIDTFQDESFGTGFLQLKKLTVLSLNSGFATEQPYCAIARLHNNTFSVFENTKLSHLYLRQCNLYQIEVGTFLPLSHITTVSMDTVKYLGIDPVIRAMFGFSGRNISQIICPHCYYPHRTSLEQLKNQMISKETTSLLKNICIEYLDLSHNRILYVDDAFAFAFAKCLRHLDLSHNYILGQVSTILELSLFKKLEYADISFQISSKRNEIDNVLRTGAEELDTDTNISNSVILTKSNLSPNVVFYLPPRLRILKLRSIVANIGKISLSEIRGGQHLTELDLAYNGLKAFRQHVRGLEHVQSVDLSGNTDAELTEHFLTSFYCAAQLFLNNMGLSQGTLLPGGPLYNGIRSLVHLTRLELSGNKIQFLPSDLLNPLTNISYVNLADNSFVKIPFDLSFIPKDLTFLDMSSNSLTYMSNGEMNTLDTLSYRHSLTLKLEGNPISCSCQALPFIRWLSSTVVALDQRNSYTCVDEEGVITSTTEVNVNLHWRRCRGLFWFLVAVTLMCFLTVVAVSTLLILRNLTYFQHRLLILLGRGAQEGRVTRHDFQKDAYIAHCELDSQLACHDIGMVLKQRYLLRLILSHDCLPGHLFIKHVVDSVNASWKTVLVVTENFLEDDWSYFTMQIAANAVTNTNPNRVILLLIGRINEALLPEFLLSLVSENNIFHLSNIPDEECEEWTHIKNRILNGDEYYFT